MSRSRKIESVVDAIGNTPLVRLRHVGAEAPGVAIYLKLEFANPGGSVKDRAARQMVLDAMKSGRLGRGQTLIDSTSGNTGVAYAMIGAALGFPVRLVMPDNVSIARKNIVRGYGTDVVYTDPMEGSDGALRVVRQIVEREPEKYFYPDQYSNASNPLAHYLGTGAEILDQVGDRITHFVTGIGTTGTLMGTSRRLHESPRGIKCIAVFPKEPLHGLEGFKHLGTSIVPPIYDASVHDDVIEATTEDGWNMADEVARKEGMHIGHSSGANVWAAVEVAKRIGEGVVVTIACDRGDRYFAPMKWERRYEW